MSAVVLMTGPELEALMTKAARLGAAQALAAARPTGEGVRLESPRECAGRLRVNVRLVREAIARGELPAVGRPGRGGKTALWIKPEEADRVLAGGA